MRSSVVPHPPGQFGHPRQARFRRGRFFQHLGIQPEADIGLAEIVHDAVGHHAGKGRDVPRGGEHFARSFAAHHPRHQRQTNRETAADHQQA